MIVKKKKLILEFKRGKEYETTFEIFQKHPKTLFGILAKKLLRENLARVYIPRSDEYISQVDLGRE
jgi:hypothetical protein